MRAASRGAAGMGHGNSRPPVICSMAIAAVDNALWDLKACLLDCGRCDFGADGIRNASGAYGRKDALAKASEFAAFGVSWFEGPCLPMIPMVCA